MRWPRPIRLAMGIALAILLTLSLSPPGWSQTSPGPAGLPATPVPAVPAVSPVPQQAIDVKQRPALLGSGWAQSRDLAWTTIGDAAGFHVLVAEERSGYAWRTAATLSEPGFDTDRWIGNACLTGSGRRLVVVYAPRTFTNRDELFSRGGFVAVVDLVTGNVRKVPLQASLAYFDPGCGVGESAVLTQGGGETKAKTRLVQVNAATARLGRPLEMAGQVTSAIPVSGGIVAADGARLIRISEDGRRTQVARANSVPGNIKPDAGGGVVFMDHAGDIARVHHVAAPRPGAKATLLGTGPLVDVDVESMAGRVFITGGFKPAAGLPRDVVRLAAPKSSRPSRLGHVALTQVQQAGRPDFRQPVIDPVSARIVRISMKIMASGRQVTFDVDPAARTSKFAGTGRDRHPKLASRAGSAKTKAALAGSPNDPVEAERYCSVPRNDPRNQAAQPKPRQVEWAADQAVRGALTVQRETNWKGLGMPAYTPQGLFPRQTLLGAANSDIPVQIVLGILAQESNLWQASRAALPGVTANPLIGNFYGLAVAQNGDISWDVRWDKADCGYGVTQMTDGMRLAGKEKPGEKALAYQTQRAVALDFAANIAAGVQLLGKKWGQVREEGLLINNGDHSKLENWFYAIWAYNSGYHPSWAKDGVDEEGKPNNGAWGLGWANNPINPVYKQNRAPFMETSYADAATPQYWPYPEKVLGFAGHPIESLEAPNAIVHGYRAAWWPGGTAADQNRKDVKPPITLFCDASSSCNPSNLTSPCGRADYKCWYHQSRTWKTDCDTTCGRELLRFDPGYPYQEDGNSYPPNCTRNGLPSGALVVDDVPASTPIYRPGCGNPGSVGTFGLSFESDAAGLYPSKIDFHQLGAGYAGHFWFAHTRQPGDPRKLKVTGTWTLDRTINGWARVMVHTPDHGAHTQQAHYQVYRGGTKIADRYVPTRTRANQWVNLGVFNFASSTDRPRVVLASDTFDGNGNEDVAWDSVAFAPLPAKPRHFIVNMGDSYASGEGAGNYEVASDNNYGNLGWNACHRSANSWTRRAVIPGTPLGTLIGTLANNGNTDLDFASVACSGATTENMMLERPAHWFVGLDPDYYATANGQFREYAQIKSGFLDSNTTLVTLGVGGDDGGFSGVMQKCATSGCANDHGYEDELKRRVDMTVVPNVRSTIAEIHSRARNAKIVFMGYPELFKPGSNTNDALGGALWGFDYAESAMLSRVVYYMRDKLAAVVQELRTRSTDPVPTYYADPIKAFEGHRVGDSDEWIHRPVAGPEGEGDFPLIDLRNNNALCQIWRTICVSRTSFHPKMAGADAHATVLTTTLTTISYRW